jgi:hypothetical protein
VSACAGLLIPLEPDVIDVTLSAEADRVKTAVIQTLTEGGYAFDRKDDENLTTGHRGGKSVARGTGCSGSSLVQEEAVWMRCESSI